MSGGEPQVCSGTVASVDLQCGIEVCCFGLVGAPASFVWCGCTMSVSYIGSTYGRSEVRGYKSQS